MSRKSRGSVVVAPRGQCAHSAVQFLQPQTGGPLPGPPAAARLGAGKGDGRGDLARRELPDVPPRQFISEKCTQNIPSCRKSKLVLSCVNCYIIIVSVF